MRMPAKDPSSDRQFVGCPFLNAPAMEADFVDSSKPGIMLAEFSAVQEDMWL